MKLLATFLLLLGLDFAAPAAELFCSSFEAPSVGPFYSVFYVSSALDGWTVSNGSVEIVGTLWQAAAGDQSVDLSGVAEMAGTIYRDVTTVADSTYTLRFALTGNPGAGDAIKEMNVLWNNVEVTNLTASTVGLTFADMGWKYYELTLQATGAISRITFQSLTLNPFGPVIDDISLTGAVPPPLPVTLKAELYSGILVEGPAGVRQLLQYTTDPAQASGWKTFGVLTIPAEGKFFYIDPEPATTEHRYYRTILAE